MGYVAAVSAAVLSPQSDAKVTEIAIFRQTVRLIGPSAKRRVDSASLLISYFVYLPLLSPLFFSSLIPLPVSACRINQAMKPKQSRINPKRERKIIKTNDNEFH